MPTRAQLLADRALYLSFMQRLLDSMGETCDEIDCEAEYELLQDPPARQRLMLDHFWMMWDAHLAAEWERRLPSLRDSVAAFESLDLRGMSVTDAVRRIIRRDEPPEWSHWRDGIERLVFVPSPHIGPYLLSFHEDTPFALSFHEDTPTALVVFGARIPEGAIVRSSALSRSDLLMRLGALADDTRLRILELVALEGEQGAKEIMDYFGLSKSAASRHLRQLTAHGYLIVRQQEVSKYYRPNPDRIDETCRALKAFLKSDRT
jgi:DNA-binding transcriptional ArsR family regulator